MNGELPADWKADAKAFVEKLQANPANIASRKASQNALEAFGKVLPEFWAALPTGTEQPDDVVRLESAER